MFGFLNRAWTRLINGAPPPDMDYIYKSSDDESSDDGAIGSMIVAGAVSKGDGDKRMTAKQQKKLMRAAKVSVRAMADSGDAMDKARSGEFNTLQSEIKAMDGLGLYNFISANPSHMSQVGNPDVQRKMINDGYGKQLDVLAHGTYEAAQKAGRKEVMTALMVKPLSQMTPDEQSYIWDKLSELGEVSGNYDDDLGGLEAAVSGFVSSTPAGEQMVANGKIQLGSGSELNRDFVDAVEPPGVDDHAAYVERVHVNKNIFKLH